MRFAALAPIVALGGIMIGAACGHSRESPPAAGSGIAVPASEVRGTIVVGGTTVAITRCNPQHDIHTYLELETAKGVLRFKESKLYWQDKELGCSRLDRSWGGGVRPDGAAYWRGTLDFDCGEVTGKIDADCGRITAEERASLDANRQQLRVEQAAQRDAGPN